ncbi:MAG: Asp-tRNA(Asn)/Glu-tRNA(Gln) amidotransferase subunit GatA [Chitinophagaceae bacterium]|nr:MAG: Asp-tRNA(Asn)/Glu-tRNA(Gln) amidotransferase subunit GatA [Chitinophagaceae bacterium]
MNYTKISALQKDLYSGKISCIKIVNYFLQNIEKNKHLNAFNEVFSEEAIARAEVIDKKIKDKSAGKMAGVVFGIKDILSYKGHKLEASSKILKNFEAIYSATVIEKLLAEDAIIIGRLNCDEFAMGSSNENSAFGNVLNALDLNKVPGGSSGGSAVAVQADLCHASLGTDTGGSIRQPASLCGIYGLKPSYGRVSRYGMIAFASSFDQIGPFAKSVDDLALILEVISGKDPNDATSSEKNVEKYSQFQLSDKKYKIAYFKEVIENEALDKEIKTYLNDKIASLKADGHTVEAVSFPYLDYLVPTYYVLTTAEASSNLSRYDGVKYGYRSQDATDMESTYKKTRSEGFGKEVKRRIMLGTFVLSAGYYDAYYGKAQKVRRLILEATNEIYTDFDFILSPTTPTTAFEIGEKTKDPVTMYLSDIFTVQANLCGFPAISIPCGVHSNGMPFGMQLMSKKFDESSLLSFSRDF